GQPQPWRAGGAGGDLDVRHHDGAPEQVVEDDDRVRDHHHGVGYGQRVGGRMRQALHGAHQVVAEVAHRAAREAGQARDRDRRQGAHALGQVADRVVRVAHDLPPARLGPAVDRPAPPAPAAAPHLARLGAQEGVAGPALSPHQRFQQERERGPGDLDEGGQRRVGVEHHLAQHGDHATALGARQEVGAGVAHRATTGVEGICDPSPPRSPWPASLCRPGSTPRRGARTRRSRWRAAPRDVPHPLSAVGLHLYEFALGDTTIIALPEREVRVVALRVRPKSFDVARIVGILYVDAASADLVRMAFNFTPRSYLDSQLEDVSIVLDNALWEQRYWLPYRQEIEIRRRATWLDVPARGIIRARWEIDGYVFNVGLAQSWFAGDEISFVPKAERDSFPWTEPLATALENVAEPVRRDDLERVRAEVEEIP